MNAIDLLLNRVSYNKLLYPAPQGEQLNNILQAGCNVPDHGGLMPWRFILFKDESLTDLGEIFAEAAEQNQATDEQIAKAKNMPLRAPLIIAVIAKITPEHKIPESEQLITAGCSVHAMQMAAVAQGFQGIWRTGAYAYHPYVQQQLKLGDNEQIVGYLYLGTPDGEVPKKQRPNPAQFVQYW
ncbi:Protein ydjA [Catenovulum agarivorans DS-2]|uniref:Putative NAD(P)H nitroreductase n=1 Tax=Catenovulum agarivorans DS-2 TaxID=1328313 RepID=W7R3N5_9ALTE|nr:NAD(P)H nitroreductase [Catenovulum agarivorans]EWH12235.1 Protein ydjA [Catenovulum agarivorans DS-2]